MNKIERLIEELCPEGVERVKLISVASALYGCPFDARLFTEDDAFIPLIRIRDVLTGKPSTYYRGEYEDKYIIHQGDIIVGMDGNFNLGKWNSIDGVLCQRVCKIASKTNNKVLDNYLYHYLKPEFRKIEENTPGGSVKHLSAKTINNLEIPLPPLPIQEEIVKILDKFSAMVDNIDEELKLRQKQYEYYREKLLNADVIQNNNKLSFGNDFILKARIGWQGLTKNEYRSSGDYYLITGTDFTLSHTIDFKHCVHVNKDRYEQDPNIQIQKGDVLITKDGTLGKVAFISNIPKPATLNGGVFVVRCKNNDVDSKFLMYYLSSNIFKNWIKRNHTNGSIMHLTQKLLVNFSIPVPALSRQQQSVSILDKFEAIIANLKEEKELRQKQYEYYRDKLLTFD